MKTKQLIFWIIYTVLLAIFGLLIIFYLDLANGPMPLLILELLLISIYFCSLDYHCGDFSPTNLNAYLKLFPYGILLEMELLGKGI